MIDYDEETASPASDARPYSASFASPNGEYSFDIYVGDDGIAYGTSRGYEDKQSSESIRALFYEIQSHLGRHYSICFDISQLEELTPQARTVWSDTALAKNSPFVRVAVFGGGFFIRSLMNFYARIAHMPVRLFKTRSEAVAWLEEETP